MEKEKRYWIRNRFRHYGAHRLVVTGNKSK